MTPAQREKAAFLSLLRVATAKTEEAAAQLAALGRRRMAIMSAIEALEDALGREEALATDAETLAHLGRFRQGVADKRRALDAEARQLGADIETGEARLAAALTEARKFEVVLERNRLDARQAARKRDQDAGDDAALVRFRRAEAD